MFSDYNASEACCGYPWQELEDVSAERMGQWRSEVGRAGMHREQPTLPARIAVRELDESLRTHAEVLTAYRYICKKLLDSTFKNMVFLLISVEGVLLDSIGPPEFVAKMQAGPGISPGTLFTLSHTGINAITVSQQLGDWVFLRGAEHDLQLFADWSCCCAPIRQGDRTVAYLDMSFSDEDDYLLLATLFKLARQGIEQQLSLSSPDVHREQVLLQFTQYKLTAREQQIGYRWLMNHSALRIASDLGIAEGTVRNMIKKVYRKTNVCDKGQYMRMFL